MLQQYLGAFRRGRPRYGLSQASLFGTFCVARKTLEEWQEDYNWRRPHSASANLTPMEFLQKRTMHKMAAQCERCNSTDSTQS
ncbi:integrase core domain-containing protein [Octadecabacter arcticus]|uniref:integrase core domain-containing protein n=1 Tax=Octadecabacter arcticus TaxID=53946 RepID=UPI0009FC15F7